MAWTFGGTKLVVTKVNDSAVQAIARLQPLASGTLYHHFGYEFLVKKLSAYIVGQTDKNTFINYSRTGDSYALINPAGYTLGDYYIKNVNFDMQSSIFQDFLVDADHDCDDQIFVMDMELFKDE